MNQTPTAGMEILMNTKCLEFVLGKKNQVTLKMLKISVCKNL